MAAVAEQATSTALRPAIAGRNPWALAWRRLRANRIALAALVLFLLIVVLSLAAPLYAHRRRPRGQPARPQPERHDRRQRPCRAGHAAGRRRPEAGRDPGRPDVGCAPLLPRRRPARPGRCVAAAVRRARLAPDRHLLGSPVQPRSDGGGAGRRFLWRPRRRDPVPADGRDLGLPGPPAGDLDRHRVADPLQRRQDRSAAHHRDQPVDAHGHHRPHLRAVRVPAGPRPGAVGP